MKQLLEHVNLEIHKVNYVQLISIV